MLMENPLTTFTVFLVVYELIFSVLLDFTNVGHFIFFTVILKTWKKTYCVANLLQNPELSSF